MLGRLLASGLSAGIAVPAWAQQALPIQRPTSPNPAASQSVLPAKPAETPTPADSQVVVVDSKELARVLAEWEQKTARITKLQGRHERYEYDDVFTVEKRAVGSFWFEAPDKGRIDFDPGAIPTPPVNPQKRSATGVPYSVQPEDQQSWVCTGTEILQIDVKEKQYSLIQIPPQHRGQNIIDGPLPFLFGVKADQLKERYKLSIGDKHGVPGSDQRVNYHIVAAPLRINDAQEWSRAEVLLDAEYCLPTAIRLIDPGGQKTTVYRFPLGQMKANSKVPWFPSPFKPMLTGYKLIQSQTATAPSSNGRSSSIVPVGR